MSEGQILEFLCQSGGRNIGPRELTPTKIIHSEKPSILGFRVDAGRQSRLDAGGMSEVG